MTFFAFGVALYFSLFFFFNDTATTEISPRSLVGSVRMCIRDSFFDGLDLLEPGVVRVQEWRPGSETEARSRSNMWGGVARKR